MPAERAHAAGYNWMAVGENIAEGAGTPKWSCGAGSTVRAIASNIMGPQSEEMGLAYFTDFAHKGDIYWAQTFGTQQEEVEK